MKNSPTNSLYQRIYTMVDQIPEGYVATYGQIANLVGSCGARQVGYALAALHDEIDVPWHRVINSQGCISMRTRNDNHQDQRKRLLSEGINFNDHETINLEIFRWPGPGKAP